MYLWWSFISCFLPSKENAVREKNLTFFWSKSKCKKSLFSHSQIYNRHGKTSYFYLWNKTDLTSVTTSRLALYPAQTMATWMVCGRKGTKRTKIKAWSCVLSFVKDNTHMTVLLLMWRLLKILVGVLQLFAAHLRQFVKNILIEL